MQKRIDHDVGMSNHFNTKQEHLFIATGASTLAVDPH
jgi:hypothetical protein